MKLYTNIHTYIRSRYCVAVADTHHCMPENSLDVITSAIVPLCNGCARHLRNGMTSVKQTIRLNDMNETAVSLSGAIRTSSNPLLCVSLFYVYLNMYVYKTHIWLFFG